jgi:hypothetical protein
VRVIIAASSVMVSTALAHPAWRRRPVAPMDELNAGHYLKKLAGHMAGSPVVPDDAILSFPGLALA